MRKSALLLALLWPAVALGQGSPIHGTAVSFTGQAIPYAQILVCVGYESPITIPCTSGASSASLYANPALTGTAIPNPTNADQNGNYENFFVTPGPYTIQVSGAGYATNTYYEAVGGSGSGWASYALKPFGSDQIQFVSADVNASDSNDGLSPGSARATHCAAKAALPNGGVVLSADGNYNWTTNCLSGLNKPWRFYFGAGTITVSSGVQLGDNLSTPTSSGGFAFIGAGKGKTIFSFTNTGAVDGFAWNIPNRSGVDSTIGGFTVNMNGTGTGDGIHFLGFARSLLFDVEVENAGGHGLEFKAGSGSYGQGTFRSEARDVYTHNNGGHGWYVHNTLYLSGNGPFLVVRLDSESNAGDGIRSESFDGITRNSGNEYVDARTEVNGGSGMNVVCDGDIYVTKLETEGNMGYGLNTACGISGQYTNGVIVDWLGAVNNTAGLVNVPSTALNVYYHNSFRPFDWGMGNFHQWQSVDKIVLRSITSGCNSNILFQFQDVNKNLLSQFDACGRWSGTAANGGPGMLTGADGNTAFVRGNSGTQSADIFQAQAANTTPFFRVGANGSVFSGTLVSIGSGTVITGTGACTTITTQVGGAWSGSFKCTGTTGSSTVTITPANAAPNGWSCSSSDITAAAVGAQSASTPRACTVSYATVTQNDVLTFTATAF